MKKKNKVLFYSSVKNKSLFFTQQYYRIDIEILEELGFNVLLSNNIFDAFSFWKYNIAFLYFYRYSFFTGLIAKIFKKKIFFTGGIDNLEKEFATKKDYLIQKLFFKLCYIIADRCIIVSSSDLKNIKRIYPHKKKFSKIVMSFHAIEIEKYLTDNLQNRQKNSNFTTIVWMGSKYNVIRKGVDLSLKLFSLLIKNYPEYSNSFFIIMGKEGEGTEYLKNIIKDLNLEDRVIITGEIEENLKIEILKQNRFYFQLSKYEGFGISALEALAAGNIIINSGKGGLVDSVSRFGVIVNIDTNLESQIDTIHKDLSNKNGEKNLELGREYASKKFSINRRKEEFKSIIK